MIGVARVTQRVSSHLKGNAHPTGRRGKDGLSFEFSRYCDVSIQVDVDVENVRSAANGTIFGIALSVSS